MTKVTEDGIRRRFQQLDKKRSERNVNDELIEYQLNKTIKTVTEFMEIIAIRDAINEIILLVSNLRIYKINGVIEQLFNKCKEHLLLLLHPFIPHITEELWEMTGHKDFLSLAEWPSYDKSFITEENDFKWKLMNNTIDDIKSILQVVKEKEIKKISLIISDDWKFSMFSVLMPLTEDTKNQGEIMKELMKQDELKQRGKDMNRILVNVLKNIGSYSKTVLNSAKEKKFFDDIKPNLKQRFECEVDIVLEGQSEHSKAKQALPGRPGIVVE